MENGVCFCQNSYRLWPFSVSERKENTEGIERLDYCKVCCNFKPSKILAGNVHKTPKQGERKGQMDGVVRKHCLFVGEFPSDTEPLVEISLPSNFRFFCVK